LPGQVGTEADPALALAAQGGESAIRVDAPDR
jgi:hypothetical protein